MTDIREVLACDESFSAGLLAADHDLPGAILTDDFITIDVLSGRVARREELLGALSIRQLRFVAMTQYAGERSVCPRTSAAVVSSRALHAALRFQVFVGMG